MSFRPCVPKGSGQLIAHSGKTVVVERQVSVRASHGPHVWVPQSNKPPNRARPNGSERDRCAASLQLPVMEIDFAQLDDGSLLELVEDPRDATRTLLAIWKDGRVDYTNRLEHDGRVFVPLQKTTEIFRRVRLPRSAKTYESPRSLRQGVGALISRCVALHDTYIGVLAAFVLSTWLVDCLPVAPYLSVVGLPQSGKTTLLNVLSLICRRPLLIADITSASFYQACARFMPTMLIDETGTAANSRALRHILRSGTTRDVLAVRKNGIFHCYGAKVICWLESPDDAALNSRCILIPMSESKSISLVWTDDPKVQQMATDLQAQLLR